MWDPPPQNETHGIIRQYSIRYRRVTCDFPSTHVTTWTLLNLSGAKRFTEIKDLTKWSCYAVQINAATVKTGKWSEEIQRRTSEDGKIKCFILFMYTSC